MVMADTSSTVLSVAFGWIRYGGLNILTSAGRLLFSSAFSHVVGLQKFELLCEKAAVYLCAVQLLT